MPDNVPDTTPQIRSLPEPWEGYGVTSDGAVYRLKSRVSTATAEAMRRMLATGASLSATGRAVGLSTETVRQHALGRVKHPPGIPKPMRPTLLKGYPAVVLIEKRRGLGRWFVHVHVLVALVFYGPRPDGLEVRHLDGNKLHSSADNLRYGTNAENNADKLLHGSMPSGANHYRHRLKPAQVSEIRRRCAAGARTAAIADEFGLTRESIRDLVARRSWADIP